MALWAALFDAGAFMVPLTCEGLTNLFIYNSFYAFVA
jgi:hypothetical protein